MATYFHNKSNAFKKLEDQQNVPFRRRSESRLKRYSSAVDSRVWAHYAIENKAYIIDLMGQDPTKKRKVMGRIIPIDVIWNIMLSSKNKYILELEDQIQCFVDLLHVLDLSSSQLDLMKHLATSSFERIKDLLGGSRSARISNGMEKSIQVKPITLTTIAETKISTTNVGCRTNHMEFTDRSSVTEQLAQVTRSSSTVYLAVSHVSVQAIQDVCDKAILTKPQSESNLLARKSKTEQTSEVDLSVMKLSGYPSMKRAIPEKSIINKSQSATQFTHATTSVVPISSRTRKSCVTFKENLVDELEHDVKFGQSKVSQSIGSLEEKSEESEESMAAYILDNVLTNVSPQEDDFSLVDVVSKCQQASSKTGPSSVIQLYKSTKSSIESTYIKNVSELFAESPKIEEVESDVIVKETAVSAPQLRTDSSSKTMSMSVIASSEGNIGSDFTSSSTVRATELRASEDSEDDEEFKDCELQFPAGEKCKLEVEMYNGAERVETITRQLERRNKEVMKHKLLAKRAIWQLDMLRKTLEENQDAIVKINVQTILKNVQNYSLYPDEIIKLETDLRNVCKSSDSNACRVLTAQLQLLKEYCTVFAHDDKSEGISQKGTNFDSSHLLIVNIPSTDEGGDAMKYREQVEYWKNKLVKLDQVNLERDKLRDNVLKMENELRLYSGIKSEFVLPQLAPNDYDDEEYSMLQIGDIQSQIIELKTKALQYDNLHIELEREKTQNAQLRNEVARISAFKFNDYEALRYKVQEVELLRLERDRLVMRVKELQRLQADNVDLQSKCLEWKHSFHTPPSSSSTRSISCSTECMNVAEYKEDYAFAKEQAEQIAKLKKEKEALLVTIVTKECELAEQEEQIERLVMHVDRLTTNNELQQEKSKQLVSKLRSQLEAKEAYVIKMDNELQWVEEKLRASIDSLSKDSSEWQTKLTNLESCCRRYKAKIDSMQDTISNLQKQLDMQEELNKSYSIELQKKDKMLEDVMKNSGDHLYENRMKNVNRMENILKKSHTAVRKVVEELAKQYQCDLRNIREVVPEMINN